MSTQSNGNSVLVQGRLIWTLGQDIFAGKQKTNQQTKQVVIDLKTGQPAIEYGFGLAVLKTDPRTGQYTPDYVKIYQALHAEALTLFPGGQVPHGFAMKVKDGDTAVDDKGQPYSTREGYANHYVVTCTTQIPIKYFKWDGQQNVLVNMGIKNGDYVNVQLNIKAHPAVGQAKAGLYVNPSAVQFIAEGKAIINTPSGDQMFGMNAPQYSGQIEAPVMGAMPNIGAPQQNAQMPPQGMPNQQMNYGQQQMGMPPQGQPAMPNQQMQQNFQQPMQAAPHYDILPTTHQPQQNGQMPLNGQGQMGMPPQGQVDMPNQQMQMGNQQNVQYGQMNTAPMGTQNQYAQNGQQMGQNFTQPTMNGMTAQQNVYPSNNGMPMPPQR